MRLQLRALMSGVQAGYGMVLNLLHTRSLEDAKAFLERSFGNYLGAPALLHHRPLPARTPEPHRAWCSTSAHPTGQQHMLRSEAPQRTAAADAIASVQWHSSRSDYVT